VVVVVSKYVYVQALNVASVKSQVWKFVFTPEKILRMTWHTPLPLQRSSRINSERLKGLISGKSPRYLETKKPQRIKWEKKRLKI